MKFGPRRAGVGYSHSHPGLLLIPGFVLPPSAPLLLTAILSLPSEPPNPPLCDLQRMPSLAVAKENLAFNRRCHRIIAAQAGLASHQDQLYDATLSELDALYYVWDQLADAQSQSQNESFRRRSLWALREQAGWPAYYSGRLPPAVPVWRFPLLPDDARTTYSIPKVDP